MTALPDIRLLGRREYGPVWESMRAFVDRATQDDRDRIWFVEHEPVFTLGQNGKPEHVLAAGEIPVVNVDRGGQVTYHGPGQLVVYPMICLPRLGLGIRDLVSALERTVVGLAAHYGLTAVPRRDAPGVYVNGAKLASIGLRIRRDWCYHGMALNVDMDMEPFLRINPCGFAGMAMTQLKSLGGPGDLKEVARDLLPLLLGELGYNIETDELRLPEEEAHV